MIIPQFPGGSLSSAGVVMKKTAVGRLMRLAAWSSVIRCRLTGLTPGYPTYPNSHAARVTPARKLAEAKRGPDSGGDSESRLYVKNSPFSTQLVPGPLSMLHAPPGANVVGSKWVFKQERSLENAFCTPAKYDLDGFSGFGHFGPRMFLLCRPFGSHLMSQQMSLVMSMRHSPALPRLFFRLRDPIIQEADECFVAAQLGALGCL